MGCTCGYNTDLHNKPFNFEEFNEKRFDYNYDPNKLASFQEELIRVTSMSRISSQRSVLLSNIKKVKDQKEPMKIGNLMDFNINYFRYNWLR